MSDVETRFAKDESLHSTLAFWSQLARTNRQYSTLTEDYDPAERSFNSLDRFFFFFLCVDSLRDWLKTCPPEALQFWREKFDGTLEWKICRDVSNSFKHLELNSPQLDGPVTIIREYRWADRHRISIIANGTVLPLFDVARVLWTKIGEFVSEADEFLPPRGRGVGDEFAS